MTKLKDALLSLGASGKLGDAVSFVTRGRLSIAEKRPKLIDARSEGQLSWRHMFNKCVDLWHTLSPEEKQEWESLARPRHMTGYAWYISQCLRPNPGIYLPLQGGTMQGDIDMAKYRLLKLPSPTDDQEPVTKKYFEDNPAVGSLDDLDDVNVPTPGDGDFIYYDSVSGTWKNLAHKDAATGVHGVGSDYVAKAAGSQYTAVNRDGDLELGRNFRRAVADDWLNLGGGPLYSPAILLYGKDAVGTPGVVDFAVPNAAKTGWLYPLTLVGVTDTPWLRVNPDNTIDFGSASYRLRNLFAVTVTEGDHGFGDKQCAECGKEFGVGDKLTYLAIENTPDTKVKEPNIVKKLRDPTKPARERVRHLNEWTGEYEEIEQPVRVTIKRDHYKEVEGKVVKELVEVEVGNEYQVVEGIKEVEAHGFTRCRPICKLCFLAGGV